MREGENLRYISRLYKNKLYGKFSGVSTGLNKYKSTDEIAVRNFLKGLLANPPKFNLQPGVFYDYKEIIAFVNGYNPHIKIKVNNLALYKRRNVQIVRVQKTNETEAFVKYVKEKFKDFDEKSFYNESR